MQALVNLCNETYPPPSTCHKPQQRKEAKQNPEKRHDNPIDRNINQGSGAYFAVLDTRLMAPLRREGCSELLSSMLKSLSMRLDVGDVCETKTYETLRQRVCRPQARDPAFTIKAH